MKSGPPLSSSPVLLALCAGSAAAKNAPPKSGVDTNFGKQGKALVAVPKSEGTEQLQIATGPYGESYVLDEGLLLGFTYEGKPDLQFGTNGRERITAAAGETTEVTGLAVDAKGRILVSGSVNPTPGAPNESVPAERASALYHPEPSNAFVIRYLPDGERDTTFGGAGEIDVTLTPPPRTGSEWETGHFEHLVVRSDRLAVVNGETPVLGGSYFYYVDYCYYVGVHQYAFATAIDPAGPALQTIPPTAYAQFQQSDVTDLAPMPGGNLAVLTYGSGTCSNRAGPEHPTLTPLTFGGTPAPALDPVRAAASLSSLAVDAWGRFVGIRRRELYPPEVSTPSSELVRMLPDGDYDTDFGSYGRVPLTKLAAEGVDGLAIDAKRRPVVGGGQSKFRVARFGTKGKIDKSFGDHGWVEVGFGPGSKATLDALSIDPQNRILAVGRVTGKALKTGVGVGLIRIRPGN